MRQGRTRAQDGRADIVPGPVSSHVSGAGNSAVRSHCSLGSPSSRIMVSHTSQIGATHGVSRSGPPLASRREHTGVKAFAGGDNRIFGRLRIWHRNMSTAAGPRYGFYAGAGSREARKDGKEYHELPYSVKGRMSRFSGLMTAACRCRRNGVRWRHSTVRPGNGIRDAHGGHERPWPNREGRGAPRRVCTEHGLREMVRRWQRPGVRRCSFPTAVLQTRCDDRMLAGDVLFRCQDGRVRDSVRQRFRTHEVESVGVLTCLLSTISSVSQNPAEPVRRIDLLRRIL